MDQLSLISTVVLKSGNYILSLYWDVEAYIDT